MTRSKDRPGRSPGGGPGRCRPSPRRSARPRTPCPPRRRPGSPTSRPRTSPPPPGGRRRVPGPTASAIPPATAPRRRGGLRRSSRATRSEAAPIMASAMRQTSTTTTTEPSRSRLEEEALMVSPSRPSGADRRAHMPLDAQLADVFPDPGPARRPREDQGRQGRPPVVRDLEAGRAAARQEEPIAASVLVGATLGADQAVSVGPVGRSSRPRGGSNPAPSPPRPRRRWPSPRWRPGRPGETGGPGGRPSSTSARCSRLLRCTPRSAWIVPAQRPRTIDIAPMTRTISMSVNPARVPFGRFIDHPHGGRSTRTAGPGPSRSRRDPAT